MDELNEFLECTCGRCDDGKIGAALDKLVERVKLGGNGQTFLAVVEIGLTVAGNKRAQQHQGCEGNGEKLFHNEYAFFHVLNFRGRGAILI